MSKCTASGATASRCCGGGTPAATIVRYYRYQLQVDQRAAACAVVTAALLRVLVYLLVIKSHWGITTAVNVSQKISIVREYYFHTQIFIDKSCRNALTHSRMIEMHLLGQLPVVLYGRLMI